jgi:hypothetical protein
MGRNANILAYDPERPLDSVCSGANVVSEIYFSTYSLEY